MSVDFTNEAAGVVNADVSGQSLSFSVTNLTNHGLMEATSQGNLSLSGTIDNTGGTISGSNNGSTSLNSVTVTGGVVSATSGGTLYLGQLATLDSVTLASDGIGQLLGNWNDGNSPSVLLNVTIDVGATYTATGHNITVLRGTIDNAGVLAATASSYPVGQYAIDGSVTLDGGGHVTLASGQINPGANWGTSEVDLSGGPDLLINIDNTIDGYGFVGANLLNTATGVIAADVSGQALSFSVTNLANRGLMEATSQGDLSLSGTIDNVAGTIEATATSSLSLSSVLITGGVVSVADGSSLYLNQLGTLDDVTLVSDGTGQLVGSASGYVAYWYGWQFQHASVLSDVTIGAGVTYTATTNNVTVLRGTIDNAGVLAAVPGSPYAGKYAIDGSVWLDGSGHVTLSSGQINPGANWGTSEVDISGVPDLFINVDNTLDGYGSVSVDFTNEAAGVVNADVSGQSLSFSVTNLTNHGLMEATSQGNLSLSGTIDNTGGTIAIGSGSSGSISGPLTGGSIDVAGGTLTVSGSVDLGNPIGGSAFVASGASLHIAGDLHLGASGTMDVAGVADQQNGTIEGTVTIDAGGILTNWGTLSLTGALVASGGPSGASKLRANVIAGGGTIIIGSAADLVLSDANGGSGGPNFLGSDGLTVGFAGNVGTLTINDLAAFGSTPITGYVTRDEIYLPNIVAASGSEVVPIF